MTAFLPTTRVDVLRGTTVNDYGDEVDVDTPVARGVPAAVAEARSTVGAAPQQTNLPASARGGVVERFMIRLRPGTVVYELDRLVDQRNGAVYQVTAVYNPQGPAGLCDVRCSALRIAAASQPVNG